MSSKQEVNLPKKNRIRNIEPVIKAINCIEDRLYEQVDLKSAAKAAGYSKYYLHRMFTAAVGISLYQYIRRRKLTEAARLLIFSHESIIDVAMACGYESRQAFTTVFKEMYKKTPGQYRKAGVFYPLQLECKLKATLSGRFLPWEAARVSQDKDAKRLNQTEAVAARELADSGCLPNIRPASIRDIPKWMELVRLVVNGYPYLEEESYKNALRRYIRQGKAMLLEAECEIIGIMLFDESCGSIDFLGIHPQYREAGLEEAFLKEAFDRATERNVLTMTTFREGDKADIGYRRLLKRLGFKEEQLLVEWGYPTQRMILTRPDFQKTFSGSKGLKAGDFQVSGREKQNEK